MGRTSRIPYSGDCKEIDEYLCKKTSVGWLIPKFINSLFRGVSQVLFVNNPLSGFLILLSIFWCDIIVGLAVILSASCAIFTAVLLHQDSSLISSGLTTYNAVLVGSVTASLWTPLYSESLSLKIWAFIILGSVVSVFVTSALANLLSSFKISLPCLTLPFNIVILVLFASLIPPKVTPQLPPRSMTVTSDFTTNGMNNTREMNWTNKLNTSTSSAALLIAKQSQNKFMSLNAMTSISNYSSADPSVAPDLFNRSVREFPREEEAQGPFGHSNSHQNVLEDSSFKDDEITRNKTDVMLFNWLKGFSGVALSMGQVYGINNFYSSVIIVMAVLIYSPMLCLMFLVGATISTFAGLLFAIESFDAVYNGIWGYNGVLSAGGVGGFFIVLTWHSFWAAAINVMFTVLIQRALIVSFTSIRLPVFTLPFVLSTLMFLSVNSSGNQLPKVDNITVPENHRREFLEKQQLKVEEKQDEQTQETGLEEVKVTNGGNIHEIRNQE